MPPQDILEVGHLMNAARDSYVENNFESVLDAFRDCGWEAVLEDVSYKSCESKSKSLHKSVKGVDGQRKCHSWCSR